MTRSAKAIEDELSDAREELSDARSRMEAAACDVRDAQDLIEYLESELRDAGGRSLPDGMDIAQYEQWLKWSSCRFHALDTLRVLAGADKRFAVKLREVEIARLKGDHPMTAILTLALMLRWMLGTPRGRAGAVLRRQP